MNQKPKDPAAVSLGRKGGLARLKALTPERRQEIARQAGKARQKKGIAPSVPDTRHGPGAER